ncbi:MAG TPA: hypothetical protein VGR02_21245 [Thermoanaerobaculia bacterium]|jgi:hypothetical protein|nr:hypothetical protein [Thermoanaerobaculia bacterium]
MRITTAHVVHGQIVLDEWAEPLPEGAELVIGLPDEVGEAELTADQLAELDESIAEADRGELIPAEDALRELRAVR